MLDFLVMAACIVTGCFLGLGLATLFGWWGVLAAVPVGLLNGCFWGWLAYGR